MGYLQLSFPGFFWPFTLATPSKDITIDLTLAYPPAPPAPCKPKPNARPATLPAELILSIVELASITPTYEPDTSLLLACSLVCKSWSTPAQTLLFRNIDLRSQRSSNTFRAAVDPGTERGRALASCVRSLRATIDPSQPFRLLPRSFALATTMCPNLKGIDLTLYGPPTPHAASQNTHGSPLSFSRQKNPTPTFDEKTLSILRSASCTITSLRFTNWSTNFSALPQLISAWPSLQNLSLRGYPPQLVAEEPCALKLSSLSLNFPPAPSYEFLDWLLHDTEKAESLRSLHVSFSDSAALEHILTAHGSKLQSLSLPTLRASEATVLAKECPALESLSIERSAAFRPRKDVALKDIALGVDGNTSLGPLVASLGEDGPRSVVLMLWKGGEKHPLLPELKRRCAELGVSCRIVRNAEVFRAVVVSISLL
ncbi:uncharacterized protein STEHIDRAFT_159842 [Stereum hirsutum FP-91666 SS1]|uniref:uncharacterized protein n=1 Tax=Stereum hirsutum (strain FP-91666) TaxID=721885 RepID=UPI000444A41A|nr:uncharacterized protein STEHIDRAFT_159842 [Stereum hirsutum FP-91666 SS1]EIM83249.1 hypothetical protein STEHIDRAFT_159842 [Stereum hirsutum FP-91666 SS1]